MKDKVNVLWLIDHVCYDGNLHGGGRLFMNLAPKVAKQGINVVPFFLRASDAVLDVFKNAPIPVTNLNKGKYDLTAITELMSMCKKHDIDVLHLFCYASSTFGRLCAKILGIPAIIHDFDTQIYFPYPLYLRLADRFLASTTALAFAASEMCKTYMADTRSVPEDRIKIMFHAIPERRWQAAAKADRSAARKTLGIEPDAPFFCCPTKLGPERGNDVLLDAFAQVVGRVPSARLALVYKPTLYHKVPKEYQNVPWIRDIDFMRRQAADWVRERGLERNVMLVESLDDPTTYFEACDAVVAPFLNERFSSVYLIEALAYGLPLIAFDIGEPRDIIEKDVNGVLVPEKNTAAFADAMLRYSTDAQLLARHKDGAKRSAGRYTADAVADKLAKIYMNLAQSRSAEGAVAEAHA